MALNKSRPSFVVFGLRWLLMFSSCCQSYGTKTDITCLQKVHDSLQDPNGYLSSWDFSDSSLERLICSFNGINCWESGFKVLSINLSDMGLKGQFPLGLAYCTSLVQLTLSGNTLNGPLPGNISKVIGFVTELYLSDNEFSGSIPENLVNCTYLNHINLANNRFSGQIPMEIGNLARIKTFNVSNNNLTGQVPQFQVSIPKENYDNNLALCGYPLDACPPPSTTESHSSHFFYKVAGATACFTFVLTVAVFAYKFMNKDARIKKVIEPLGECDRLLMSIKGAKDVKVSMFDKSLPKITWGDLIKATNSFSSSNIIGSEITGTIYKATLLNGTLLMVKRLQNSHQSPNEFLSEMTVLSNLRHPNLVPLLGFCAIKKQRFLVYKYMENGNLYDQLHPPDLGPSILGWPRRLKIAVGASKALVWLEQNCIHGKISSKSILLDQDFEPMFFELGLARLENPSEAQFSIFARGEAGDLAYMAQDYSSVNSFGVVLLELITGEKTFQVPNARKNFKRSLAEWVYWLSITNPDNLLSVIDRYLLEEGVEDEFSQFLSIACNCVSQVSKERPTMSQVYTLLKALSDERHKINNGGDLVGTCE